MPVESYLSVIGRRWKTLAAITLIPTILAVILVLFVLTPVYQATTTVIIPLRSASSFMSRSLSDLNGGSTGITGILEATQTLYNHIAIIKSRSLALRVREYLLKEKNIDLLATYPDIMKDPELSTEERKLQALAKRMQKRVRIDDTDRGVVELSFMHTDPNVSAEVCNAYVEETLAFLNDLNHSTKSDLVTFLEARQKEVDSNLVDAEAKIEKAKEETGILSVDEQATQLIKTYSDMEGLVAKAEIDYKGSQSQAQNMAKAGVDMKDYYDWLAAGQKTDVNPPAPAVDALADTTIATLRANLDNLELKRQQTLLYATPENPEVVALDSQIQTLKEQLYREFSNYYDAAVAGLVVDSTAYQAQMDVAKGILGDLDRQLNAFPPDERKLIELQRNRDVQESIYMVVSQELEQTRIQQQRNDSPFSVLDSALVPEKPVRPRKVMVPSGTMAIAFWIGILVVFMQDAGSRRAAVRG